MMELGDCRFCGSACPWRGNARPTRLSPSVAASGPPVGPRGRSGPSWPVSVSVTTRGNHPGHPTVVLPLPLRPTAVTPLVAHRLAGRRCVVPRCVRARPGGCLALRAPRLGFPLPTKGTPRAVFTRGLVAFLCCNFGASSLPQITRAKVPKEQNPAVSLPRGSRLLWRPVRGRLRRL